MSNTGNPTLYTYLELFEAVKATIRDIPDFCAKPGRKALDVPAGGGALTKFLREEMACDVSALDIDDTKWGYPEVPILKADLGRKLPFQDGTFDLVVCQEGLKHVTDQFTAIEEMARVLRPGGWMVLTMSNDLALQCRLRYLFSGYVDADRKMLQHVGNDDDKSFMYVRSIVQLPYLYYFLTKHGMEFISARTSRYRNISLFLAFLLYPIIWATVRPTTPPGHPLRRELTSLTWLAGRHNVVLCKKDK
jgi:ubiquinone/menaquinone biosynthesis C-methylase UbiE